MCFETLCEQMRKEFKGIMITGALLIIGAGIGLFQMKKGLRAIFVFGNNEPISSWVFILSGYVSTLPATVAAFFNKKIGGWWLIIAGLISLGLYFFIFKDVPNLKYIFTDILPMFVLGGCFLKLSAKTLN